MGHMVGLPVFPAVDVAGGCAVGWCDMSENSKIEWTDHTANFWWGCFKVSAGCTNCYADTLAHRYGKKIWGPPKTTDREYKKGVWKNVIKWNKQAAESGQRKRVFCMSMGDFFEDHPQVTEWRNKAFELIEQCTSLDWQLLTKRPENVMGMVPESWRDGFPPHVWIGTSVENQEQANKRVPELLKIPATVRFLSMEPLLGPVDLSLISDALYDAGMPFEWQSLSNEERGIKWVIVGGESGHNARPMHPDWVRSLRDQCNKAGVPFFFKQWGEFIGGKIVQDDNFVNGYYLDCSANGYGGKSAFTHIGDSLPCLRVGKKAAGRMLDGREWNEMPHIEATP